MIPSSPWPREASPIFPILDSSVEVDVAIIGGGIAGVMCAYELARAGKKVALLEQDVIASGSSGWTTAFITQVIDATLGELQSRFGRDAAALVWKSGAAAVDELERIITTEKIDCEFVRCPAKIFATDQAGLGRLKNEEKLATAFGLKAKTETEALGFGALGYFNVPGQAKFNPVKFLTAVAERITERGGRIFEHTTVLDYANGLPLIVKTKDGEVRAKQIVIATELPKGNFEAIKKRISVYQTYALEATAPKSGLAEGIYWDTQKPYHYFRVDKLADRERIILGGEDHLLTEKHDRAACFLKLKNFLKDLLPDSEQEIIREWSGGILETTDGLPFIGEAAKNIFVATGFSGNGMTFGALSAMLIRDLILKKSSPVSELYKITR